jgi:hypothetical protein
MEVKRETGIQPQKSSESPNILEERIIEKNTSK